MNEADVYLSDEFAEFSGKVTALHERKKEMFAEFKKLWEDHKVAMKEIDDEALELKNNFESWKVAKLRPPMTIGKSLPPDTQFSEGRMDGHNA